MASTRKPSLHDHPRSEVWDRRGFPAAVQAEQTALGRRLRALRLARALTQEQAAEKIGIHSVHVARLESGKSNVTIATLVALSRAYGVRLADLFAPGDVLPRRSRT